MKKAWVLSYPLSAQRRLWSDWADAQADLSLHWAHRSFCWFRHEAAHIKLTNHIPGTRQMIYHLSILSQCTCVWIHPVSLESALMLLRLSACQKVQTFLGVIHRGYYFFRGEYQIYSIKCVENISIFMGVKHYWLVKMLMCSTHEMLMSSTHEMKCNGYLQKKRVNFLFTFFFRRMC